MDTGNVPSLESRVKPRNEGGPLAHLGARLWIHGIREWWNFRGWKRPQGPATPSMMSSSHIHTFPRHFQGWRLPHCPFPVFTALPMNFFSPTSDLNKRWKSLWLVRPGLGSGALQKHLEISRSRVTGTWSRSLWIFPGLMLLEVTPTGPGGTGEAEHSRNGPGHTETAPRSPKPLPGLVWGGWEFGSHVTLLINFI